MSATVVSINDLTYSQYLSLLKLATTANEYRKSFANLIGFMCGYTHLAVVEPYSLIINGELVFTELYSVKTIMNISMELLNDSMYEIYQEYSKRNDKNNMYLDNTLKYYVSPVARQLKLLMQHKAKCEKLNIQISVLREVMAVGYEINIPSIEILEYHLIISLSREYIQKEREEYLRQKEFYDNNFPPLASSGKVH